MPFSLARCRRAAPFCLALAAGLLWFGATSAAEASSSVDKVGPLRAHQDADEHLDPLNAVPSLSQVRRLRVQQGISTNLEQPAEALSLDEAVRLGVQQAPQLKARDARLEAARADSIRAGRLPDPEATLGIQNLTVQGPSAYSIGADMMTMRMVGITQRLPARAERDAERAVARANVATAAALRTSTGQDVRAAVAGAWVKVWAAERKRALLADLRDEAVLAVTASKARLAGGPGSASDVLSARSELVRLDNRIDAAEADVEAARAELARWLGKPAERPLAAPRDFSTLPMPPAALRAQLDRQAPLLAWPSREEAAKAAVAEARAGKRPDWSVGASYGSRAAGRPDMLTLELGVSLPLFTAHRQDADVSARTAERAAVEAAHVDARRKQAAELESALADWRGWTRQVRRYREELLPLARDRSRIALAAYEGGASLTAWLDARRDEVSIRIADAEALEAWGRAWASLAYL
ncbi:MAG TPA: TolC family protein, partial [Burkholderiales bacterium]|nr:TolC family protein [Burkholderiales bacterium]